MSIEIELLPPTDRRIRQTMPSELRRWIGERAETAARLLNITSGNWIIHLVNDKRMIRYHQQTMNLATVTDVLTFNYTDTHLPGALPDIETIICVDEAQRQAILQDHLLPELEILLYAIHSLLHCVGYDDLTPRQARRMHRREDALLRQMALPAVYYSPDPIAVRNKAAKHGAAGARISAKRKKTRVKGSRR